MSTIQTPGTPSDIHLCEMVGLNPLDNPDKSEQQSVALLQSINPHITPRMVRKAIATGELRGIRKGRKFVYSSRMLTTWLTQGSKAGDGGVGA